MMAGFLKRLTERYRDEPEPRVFISGMPKSGTTAVARLMGLAAGVSAVSDPFHALDKQGATFRDEIYSGSMTIAGLIERFPRHFKGDIIKDPNFVFFYSSLNALYPAAKWVFTLRDPRDNIRSLLNRLDLPGDSSQLQHLGANIGAAWKSVLEGRNPKMAGETAIERIAYRWVAMLDLLEGIDGEVVSVRYEDFLVDKEGVIDALCDSVGLPVNFSIQEHMNRQFQPAGNASVDWAKFFTPHDLDAILQICGEKMRRYGYL